MLRYQLSAMPLKTLHYFGIYFLHMKGEQVEILPKATLIDQLLAAQKAQEAISLYLEADSYILHHSVEYEFYLWYEQESACRYLSIEEVIQLLEEMEYFGKAVCVMLMECGEVGVADGMLYAFRKDKKNYAE